MINYMPFKTKEQFKLYMREWRIKNQEKDKIYSRNYRLNNPDKIKISNQLFSSRKFRFKDKRIIVDENPRTGVCSNCKRSVHKKEIKRTNIHHDKYDEFNPLAYTRELCDSCHNKERWK